jgi:hypothetical protein
MKKLLMMVVTSLAMVIIILTGCSLTATSDKVVGENYQR